MPLHSPSPPRDDFARRAAVFYAAFFVFAGIQLPFVPVWLAARGLDAREIGLVLALAMAARPLVVPFATRVADRFGVLRGPLIAGVWVTTAAVLLLALVDGFVMILAAYLLVAAAQATILPFADAYALRGLGERRRDYGPVRLWGSIAFIGANLVGGVMLARFGAPNLVWALAGSLVVAGLVAFLLRPLGSRPEPAGPKAGASELWASRTFVAIVIAGSLIQSSHAVFYGFAALQWSQKGLGGFEIGALWGIGVAAEVALFAIAGRLSRWLKPIDMVGLGALGGVLRWGVMAIDPPNAALPALQLLHALSFGATHIGAMQALGEERRSATAQGDYQSVVALVFAAAMVLSGWLVAAYGSGAYLAMAAFAGLGGLVLMAARRRGA